MVNLGSCSRSFRTKFDFPNKNVLQWFPGHMGKGLKQMQSALKNVDCVIEVHDARIPISGRNPQFKHTVTGLRPHILVLNKMDLCDMSLKDKVINRLKDEGLNRVVYTDCKDRNRHCLDEVLRAVKESLEGQDRYHRSQAEDFSLMIVGVPNVGKSSLINGLRSHVLNERKATAVGAIAGITRSVPTKITISREPLIYVLDTPGILTPDVPNVEVGFKLALCSSLLDHLVGPVNIADYLLFTMNQRRNFEYAKKFGLSGPIDNVAELLVLIASSIGKTMKRRNLASGGYSILPDIESAAYAFIRAFRTGEFGKFVLDDDIL